MCLSRWKIVIIRFFFLVSKYPFISFFFSLRNSRDGRDGMWIMYEFYAYFEINILKWHVK